ncbi:hypothetical protein MNBD_GAMMA03-802 [hydrothermal vent metagenome]|uniref:Uncharacterized protein n=1 Tax=hydrothermal vent metagenome TaxID=652676 RepID=A0A3B0WKC1_9ZZZZ
MMPNKQLLLIFCFFCLNFPPPLLHAAENTPVSKLKVLGISLIEADVTSVRSHLWDIGGYLQAKSSVEQHNYDKFFPWSTMRESYYILFRYNHAGKITSVKQLYRPYSIKQNNQRTAIKIRDIALPFIQKLGQPTQIQTKGWGGSLSYRAYTWQDDKVTITIDREGGEKLGNIFIQYTVNIHDPYDVIKQKANNQGV